MQDSQLELENVRVAYWTFYKRPRPRLTLSDKPCKFGGDEATGIPELKLVFLLPIPFMDCLTPLLATRLSGGSNPRDEIAGGRN